MNIEQQIMAAIRPQLDRADELLDHYTEGLPREMWEPIMYQLKPKTQEEIRAEAAAKLFRIVAPKFRQFGEAVGAAITAFGEIMSKPLDRDELTTSA